MHLHPDGTTAKQRTCWVQKLMRYCISTLGGIAAESVFLWVLSDYVWPNWEFGISILGPTLGFELCLLINFSAVRYFVWRDRKSSLWRYHVSNASVYGVKMAFLLPIRYFSGIDIVICNFIAMGLAGLLNFILNDVFVFRKKTEQQEQGQGQEPTQQTHGETQQMQAEPQPQLVMQEAVLREQESE